MVEPGAEDVPPEQEEDSKPAGCAVNLTPHLLLELFCRLDKDASNDVHRLDFIGCTLIFHAVFSDSWMFAALLRGGSSAQEVRYLKYHRMLTSNASGGS